MNTQLADDAMLSRRPPAGRRDAVRNYHRIVAAARDVFGESGTEASMEEIAARAGVGVGTVYRRFANKDALIDELLRLATAEVLAAAEQALARADGHGLEELLRAHATVTFGLMVPAATARVVSSSIAARIRRAAGVSARRWSSRLA